VADSDVIDMARWCPGCRRRLTSNSPHVQPGDDELVFCEPETGRWHHMACLVLARREEARREEGGPATVRR